MECLFSIRYTEKFDLLLYLKSRKCYRKRIRKDRPVCPTFLILQSGHVNWYTSLLSNRLYVCAWVDIVVRTLPMVLFVVYEILIEEFLKSMVINLISLNTYVNFAHFFVLFPSFRTFCLLLLSFSRTNVL